MTDMNSILEPGMLVLHPQRPDWGTGQVQSNIGGRITVNFREEGKVVIRKRVRNEEMMEEKGKKKEYNKE